MASPLRAFPADGYTARWQRWDHDGDETLTLRWENEGWTATGEVGHEAVTYVIRLSPTWQIRQFLLFRDLSEPDLWLGTDGCGRWGEMNGAHRHDIDGCSDIHLSCTPFTSSAVIRRLRLDTAESARLHVATVDVDTLEVLPARHSYERLSLRRWRHTVHPATGHDATGDDGTGTDGTVTEFDVDEFGLVCDLPGRFRRH